MIELPTSTDDGLGKAVKETARRMVEVMHSDPNVSMNALIQLIAHMAGIMPASERKDFLKKLPGVIEANMNLHESDLATKQ